MRRLLATTLVAGLALVACGSDDDGGGSDAQDELYAELTADGTEGLDEGCLRDLVDDLSDEDAEFLLENIDSTEDQLADEGISEAALEFVGGLFSCIDLSDIDLGDVDLGDLEDDGTVEE